MEAALFYGLLAATFLTGITVGAYVFGSPRVDKNYDDIIEELIRRLREAGTIFPEDWSREDG